MFKGSARHIYTPGSSGTICIQTGMPRRIAFICGQDPSFPLDKVPNTSWPLPSSTERMKNRNLANALSYLSTPLRTGIGHTLLLIDNDGNPASARDLEMTYECELKAGSSRDAESASISKIIDDYLIYSTDRM